MQDENTNSAEEKLSISTLIHSFRSALIALIPILDSIGVGWHDEEQSEEFDGIAESLFKWMVISKIESSINIKYDFLPNVSNYSFHYKDYSKMCFITIDSEDEENGLFYVLSSFKSNEWALDSILCTKIDRNGIILDKDLEISFEDANFLLKVRMPDGELISLDSI